MRLSALLCALSMLMSCVGGERAAPRDDSSLLSGENFDAKAFRESLEDLIERDLHDNTPHKDYLIHISELQIGDGWEFTVAVLDKHSEDRGEILVKEGRLTMQVKDLDRSRNVKAELLDATAFVYEALLPFAFTVKAPSAPHSGDAL